MVTFNHPGILTHYVGTTTMNNILITSAGRRVSLLRHFQEQLKKSIPDAKVFAAELSPDLSPACQAAEESFALPRVSNPTYPNILFERCQALGIGMLIPTIDTELLVLAEHRDQFLDAGIHVIVPEVEFIKKCRDKRLIHTFFIEHDIAVPDYVDKHNPSFPLFIKPYDGSCSKDIYLIQDASMLQPSLLENEKLLFLEAIDTSVYEEFTLDLYYNLKSQLRCVVPRKRLEIRAGEVSKGLTVKNDLCTYVWKRMEHIQGLVGCITVQLFRHRDTGEVYGIEINPRFGGGYPLSYLAGANFPGWLIAECFNNEEIPFFDQWEDNLLMLRYDDEIIVHDYTHPS